MTLGDRMDGHLDGIGEARRAAVLKLVRGAAFAVPVLASFALDGRMSVASAFSNLGASGNPV